MPQSLAAIYVHLVFSTKDRRPFLSDLKIRSELYNFMGGVSKNLGCSPIVVGGVDDHVHILGVLGRTISIADWVKELKRVSNSWLKELGIEYKAFEWQSGYGAFSVSQSNVEQVKEYILNQEEHHRKQTFQDEFRALLSRHHLEWDERYVWD
ncbi:MAG: transposase [Planctomycetaceae bacterium]|nr:transposase [Planctomycetaceae bacterium]